MHMQELTPKYDELYRQSGTYTNIFIQEPKSF